MQRPYFLPYKNGIGVEQETIDFKFYSGFSASQKLKTIDSFHHEILQKYKNLKVLEISTKSNEKLVLLI